MSRDPLLDRIHALERDLAALRAEVAPAGRKPWHGVIKKSAMFLVSYWALMSFFAAIATATYVKFAFNIDYFESYRNAAAVKRLSEFHREMGDELFLRGDWKQALASYKAATAANSANTAAALGEVKCGVFTPEEGRKYADPATVAAKIQRLRTLYPDDPQVSFLEAMQAFEAGRNDEVLRKCDELLARHATFAGGYLLKSYIQQGNADFPAAVATLEKLLTFDPDNGLAHSNLGYCYLFTGQRDEALTHLEQGSRLYPTMVNAISLAEVRRSHGDLDGTGDLLDMVERNCAIPDIEQEYYVGGRWLWNHLPERPGDTDSPQNSITCSTLNQKRAVLRISQGLLAAARGQWDDAGAKLTETLQLEPLYRAFVINKLRAAATTDKLDDAARARLREAADKLAAPAGE